MSLPELRLLFEPRDLWLGVYWTILEPDWLWHRREFQLYVCLVPCFPIRLRIRLKGRAP